MAAATAQSSSIFVRRYQVGRRTRRDRNARRCRVARGIHPQIKA